MKKGNPCFFLTAYSDNETLQRAKVAEPFGYLIKPYKERELHTNTEGVITVGLDGSVTSMSPAV